MVEGTHIRINNETKEKLDKLGQKGDSYNEIIKKNVSKRNISNPDLTKEQMPLCKHIYTERESFDCWIIADTGSWLRLIRPFKNIGSKSESYMKSEIDKSIIKQIDSLDKISFKLDGSHISDIRQSCNQFGEQWKENQIPKILDMTPEVIKQYLKKINKQEEKHDNRTTQNL